MKKNKINRQDAKNAMILNFQAKSFLANLASGWFKNCEHSG